MRSTAESILKTLKKVTEEVSLIAQLFLPSTMPNGKILGRLLKKLQKEKDVLVKKLERSKRDSK